MKRLSSIMADAVAKLPASRPELLALEARWVDLLGAQLARHIKVRAYHDDTLWLTAASTQWARSLAAFQAEIIERVRESCLPELSRMEVHVSSREFEGDPEAPAPSPPAPIETTTAATLEEVLHRLREAHRDHFEREEYS